MNETELLIQAMQIDSNSEREAFLARECQGDPDKLAAIRRILFLENDLKQKFANIDDPYLAQHIEQLLSAQGRPLSSAADEVTGVMPAEGPDEEDPRLQRTVETGSQANEGVMIADRYVLQSKIGEGGMGEVWAAKQIAPVKRRVALKLIKRGMDSQTVIARF